MKNLFTLIAVFTVLSISAQQRIDGNFAFQSDPAKEYSIYVPSGYVSGTPHRLMLGLHPWNTSVWNSEMGMTLLADYGKFASLTLGEAASTNMEEVELKIDSFEVAALPHKIKSRYTRELLRRLNDYHGLNGRRLISSLGADALAGGINKSCFNLV